MVHHDEISPNKSQTTKKRNKRSKSERKRRKKAREEAERLAALNAVHEYDNEKKETVKDVEQKNLSNIASSPMDKPKSKDPYDFSKSESSVTDDIPQDRTPFVFTSETNMTTKHVDFVYARGEKGKQQSQSLDPVPYVHFKLRKMENKKNESKSQEEIESKNEEVRELMENSIDDIFNPKISREKKRLKKEVNTDRIADVLSNDQEMKPQQTLLSENNATPSSSSDTEVSNVSKPLERESNDEIRRSRSDSLGDPMNCKLSGRTVEDAVKDHSGRRPRANSTDGELNLPKRGLCDERIVLRNYEWDLDLFQPSPPRGFQNLGNTCFLNATLQCLSHLPTFCQCIAMLPAANSQLQRKLSNGEKFIVYLRSLLRKVHGLDGEPKSHPYSPKNIVKNISLLGGSNRGYKFRPGRQEDAHEFLVHLLDCLHDGELKAAGIDQNKSGWRDKLPIPRLDETTLTHRMFGGYLRSQVKCTKCNYNSNTYDPFMDLSLEVSGKSVNSLHDALREFTRKETLDSANKWKCSGCNRKVCATKQLTIFRPPLTLCIQMKRFSFGGGFGGYMHHQGSFHFSGKGMGIKNGGTKIQKAIEFPESLKLPLSDGRLCEYTLTGVVIHVGGSATSGHYTAYVKRPGKQGKSRWLHMDDSFVEPVSEKSVLRHKDAYVLFYCRKEVKLELPSPPLYQGSKVTNLQTTKAKSTNTEKMTDENSTTLPSKSFSASSSSISKSEVKKSDASTVNKEDNSEISSNGSAKRRDDDDSVEKLQDDSQIEATKSLPVKSKRIEPKEITTHAGTSKVKVLLKKLRRESKPWRPHGSERTDAYENVLLGNQNVSKWDDDEESEKPSKKQENEFRKNVAELNKKSEKEKKRKMYLDRWDAELDAGRKKKIRVKMPKSEEASDRGENPFHRLQASLLSMKKGRPKGALVSMKKRSKSNK